MPNTNSEPLSAGVARCITQCVTAVGNTRVIANYDATDGIDITEIVDRNVFADLTSFEPVKDTSWKHENLSAAMFGEPRHAYVSYPVPDKAAGPTKQAEKESDAR